MKYCLRYHVTSDRAPGTNRVDVGFEIDAEQMGTEEVFRFTTILSEEMRINLVAQGTLDGSIADGDAIDLPLMLFAVQRFEMALQSGSLPLRGDSEARAVTYSVRAEDLPGILAVASEKECAYRNARGPNLFCSVGEYMRTGRDHAAWHELQPVPVTPGVCKGCQLPDMRAICSHVAHPVAAVSFVVSDAKPRLFLRVMCNRDRREAKDVERCRAGGHACWERLVSVVPRARSKPFVAEALPEALDFLDAVWRLAFGKNLPLLRLRKAADAAALVSECTTRQDFAVGMSALDDVLKSMQIPDLLLSKTDQESEAMKGDRTFNRLEACIKNKIVDVGPRDAALEAVVTLRDASRIRVALQHSGRNHELPRLLEALQLSLVDDPTRMWAEIRRVVTDALVDIRNAIGTLNHGS
jgi:hypothetical protein